MKSDQNDVLLPNLKLFIENILQFENYLPNYLIKVSETLTFFCINHVIEVISTGMENENNPTHFNIALNFNA